MQKNEQSNDEITKYISTVSGLVRKFGPFTLSIEDDLTLAIASDTGWAIIIPRMTHIWSIIIEWARVWDDNAKRNLEIYVKVLAYPTSTRLSDIDEQYIDDIVKAHQSLTERNMKRNETDKQS